MSISLINISDLALMIIVWEVIWKVAAIPIAIKNNQKIWVFILICTNTLGVLPLLYILHFQHKRYTVIEGFARLAKYEKRFRHT